MSRAFEQATGGGAPQSAESTADARRIASDGHAYTWPQYVEAYGDDAQRCWDDAYERSTPRRIALNGQAYAWTQYVEAYGDDARRCWDDAYDRDEARPRRGTCCLSGDSDASQLAVNANGEPQPAAANDEGTPQEDALLALLSVCTLQQVQEMQPMKGIGGKTAWAKQKELRQVCLQKEVFKIDVTETWPEWRAVLRALQPNRQQLIIGPGIAQVNFRLLEGVRDPNYAKLDSGERHVFEILRVDTSSVHLHYHKNGSFDEPTVHANSGASQSTVPSVAPSGSQPVISRREAVLAGGCSSLSDPTPPGTPSSAGQVTDEEEFPRVPGSLKLIFMNGSEETCDFDEMSTVGFARARAARHEKKTSLDIQLILGQRTLTKDYAKLYKIADDKFVLSLTVIVSPETRLRRILFERIVTGYNTAW